MSDRGNTAFLQYFITEELYSIEAAAAKNQQADSVEEEPAEPWQAAGAPAYQGDNQKGVLILVEDANAEFLNEPDLNLLLKILSAVKLTLEDIALVNVIRTPNYEQLRVNKAIAFTTKHSFGSAIQKYATTLVGAKQVLLADPLSRIAASVDLKKALWAALQQFF